MNGPSLMLDLANHTALIQRAPAPAPVGARLRCLPGQAAVFLAAGRVSGVLGPGDHLLDPHALPFLGGIVQQRPGGPVVGDDLLWVRTGEPIAIECAAALDSVQDPTLGERVTPRITARVKLVVTDPIRCLTANSANLSAGAVEQWAKAEVVTEVARAAASAGRLLDRLRPENWAAFASAASSALGQRFADVGVALFSLEVTSISLPDEIAARLRVASTGPTVLGTAPRAPFAVAPGVRVRTSQAGRWLSGAVVEVLGSECELVWDGASERTRVPISILEAEPSYPGAHAAGTRVLAQWSDGAFYPATVRLFNGTQYEVVWENGQSSWLVPGQLRLS